MGLSWVLLDRGTEEENERTKGMSSLGKDSHLGDTWTVGVQQGSGHCSKHW